MPVRATAHGIALALLSLLVTLPAQAAPDQSQSQSQNFFRDGSVVLAVEAAGPLLFQDVPDGTIENTTANYYGLVLTGMIHDEATDTHRLGFGLGVASAARSATRSLTLVTPRLVYETGFPFVFDMALGGAIPLGKGGLDTGHGGVLGELGLRWALHGPKSKLTVSPGIDTMMVLNPKDPTASSAWLGAQVQLAYHPTR
ncbi:MAG: hypothetical protein GXP62_05990 [Oligoflexia bacterium]|nr:hypothetical protein [Oligoflexia bacterium]